MKTTIRIIKRKMRLLTSHISFVLVPLTAFILLIPASSCHEKKEPPYYVSKQTEVFNFSRETGHLYVEASDSAFLISAAGDLFGSDDVIFFFDPQAPGIHIGISDDLYLAAESKSSVIDLSKAEPIEQAAWLIENDRHSIKSLTINTDSLTKQQLQFIDNLSRSHPNIGLCFNEDYEFIPQLLKKFNPKWLILSDFKQNRTDILSGLNLLERLYIETYDSLIITPLPAMPRLKQLNLAVDHYLPKITADLLINNPQIERIDILSISLTDYSFIQQLARLKKLTVIAQDTLIDLDFIRNHNKLESLSLKADSAMNISALTNLHHLKWLSLNINLTQEEFNTLISTKPQLEALDFYNSENIRDLSALASLKELTVLTIADSLYDRPTIAGLKNLKYLALPEKVYQDSVYLARLESQLPDCLIGSNYGYCMGSGWLLLFFPLAALFWFLTKRKRIADL
ncbi:hypothetical protein [Gaoshiqia sp. Z1-71]|uniref:hypothetical protein n=1 Tax=Gaoshiqia hydrogeniformans TaxID=3290090 RepID=UPI003BF7D799